MAQIPKSLMERWAAVNVEDVHLATIRVYNDAGPGGKSPRIVLFLPPTPAAQHNPKRPIFDTAKTLPTAENEPDCYELDMVNDSVDNQIVVAERPKDSSFNPTGGHPGHYPANARARTTILTGRVKHECNLRPGFNENYRRQMRERHRKANTPVRSIKRMENSGLTQGGINRLSSGVGQSTSTFADLVVSFYNVVLTLTHSIPANQTQDTWKGCRADGSYAPEPTLGSHFPAVPRAYSLVY